MDEDLQAGWQRVLWDGRDDDGSALAAGVYLCSLRAGSERAARKMLLLDGALPFAAAAFATRPAAARAQPDLYRLAI